MVVFTSEIFKNAEFTPGAAGIPYINTNTLGKTIRETEFYTFLGIEGMRLQFTADTKTISNANDLDFRSFKDLGIKEGMEISFENTSDNNETYTVETIAEDGRSFVVEEVIVDELAEECDWFDDTPITDIDLYYNLIPNSTGGTTNGNFGSLAGLNAQPSFNQSLADFLSLTDRGAIQRFTASNLDASNEMDEIPMRIASSSRGWVTNTISDDATGETSQVTVIGQGIENHRQYFKITQTFHVAPFSLIEQFPNFNHRNPVDFFTDGNALKYICRIDAKFDSENPDIPHIGISNSVNGLTTWFDQNNARTRPEYYIDSITYTDDVTSEELDRLDFNRVVNVVATIKSRSGKFVEITSKIILDFLYLPLGAAAYINTPGTTLRQNFMNDRKYIAASSVGDGEYVGTDYQVLKDVNPEVVSATTMTVSFTVDMATFLRDLLKLKAETDRNYAIIITTQDKDIETNIQNDRVAILCDMESMDYDQSNPSLLEAVDNLRAYHFPDLAENPKTSVALWEGGSAFLEFPFRVESAPSGEVYPALLSAGFQIVVTKDGQDNFVLEEKIFNSEFTRRLDGVQVIDESEDKIMARDPDGIQGGEQNKILFARDSSYDDGSMKGFICGYPLVARYDFWRKLVEDSERFAFDIFKSIENPTEAWNTLQQNGWALQIRFVAKVRGYTGYEEEFEHYWDMDCKALGAAPDAGPIFTREITFDDMATGLRTKAITPGGKTMITMTYTTPSFEIMPSGYDSFWASIFADIENTGGVSNREFASTEFDADENSPFTATDADEDADESWASANLRINIFNFTKITVQTIYDDTKNNWSNRTRTILFYDQLGASDGCYVLNEDGSYMLDEDGGRVLLEECEEDASS